MVAVATPINPASVLARTFWHLSGQEPDSDDPVDVALCAARALEALERTDRPKVTASTLSFLLRLESDRIYASPEQARGDATSQRSLVFTVGVLVFEKLTGHHPFGATPVRPTTNEAVDELVPPELRAVLETAMAPFPSDRWSSLRALREELHRFVGNEGTLVAEAPRFRRRTVPPPCPGSAVRRAVGSRPQTMPTPPERRVVGSVATPPPLPPEPPLVDVSLLEQPRRGPRIARAAALMVCGAGIALGAAWFAQRGDATAPAPAEPAEPAELPELVVEADPEPAPAPEPVLAPEPEPAPAPAPEPAVFSPDVAGDAAIESMRTCFDDARISRGIELSASLRFAKTDGLTNRVYYAPNQKLTADERECVRGHLTGLSAGAAPERNTVVSYTFWISADHARFFAKVQR